MIHTVLGPIEDRELGITLPHEHIMVGFIEDGKLTRDDYKRQEVVNLILPYLLELKNVGCQTFVDCTPEYLGRDPHVLCELAEKSGLHIITNTGFYQAPYLSPFVYEIPESELAKVWIGEYDEGIESTGVKPGFIKIALNRGRLIPVQEKIVRAALTASIETGLPIQAHTNDGIAVLHVLEIMAERHFDPSRFIWVHAQNEKNLSLHEQAFKQGMWIQLDSIMRWTNEDNCKLLQAFLDRGMKEKLLLSQDLGWYSVGKAQGGDIRPYHKLFTEFIPYAVEWGIDRSLLDGLMSCNPAKALRNRS
ncbi:phosphotriesterase [Paenibacillus sp. LMG 31456]|uniref:Phosphotriesterase n=1 Tax=Paenibacillus foliorum TaxID=2654974 RepID=A0A972GM19_9BACL|nr:phosphotriesterase [Paenibacillus foliorum]NOU93281.1 phosphotriesterase [Paenibacillus foliorum]